MTTYGARSACTVLYATKSDSVRETSNKNTKKFMVFDSLAAADRRKRCLKWTYPATLFLASVQIIQPLDF